MMHQEQPKDIKALDVLNNFFAPTRMHEDNMLSLKSAIKQSKDVATSRREHAAQIARFEAKAAEFERKMNCPAFRLTVAATIIEEEGVTEAEALARTNSKVKLSQEAVKYDLT